MHPLLSLLPAGLCAAFAVAAFLETADDLARRSTALSTVITGTATTAAAATASAIALWPAIAWTIGALS